MKDPYTLIIHGFLGAVFVAVLCGLYLFLGWPLWLAALFNAMGWLAREAFFDTGGDGGGDNWRMDRWTIQKHLEWITPGLAGLAVIAAFMIF